MQSTKKESWNIEWIYIGATITWTSYAMYRESSSIGTSCHVQRRERNGQESSCTWRDTKSSCNKTSSISRANFVFCYLFYFCIDHTIKYYYEELRGEHRRSPFQESSLNRRTVRRVVDKNRNNHCSILILWFDDYFLFDLITGP